jgi:hypothetical protein
MSLVSNDRNDDRDATIIRHPYLEASGYEGVDQLRLRDMCALEASTLDSWNAEEELGLVAAMFKYPEHKRFSDERAGALDVIAVADSVGWPFRLPTTVSVFDQITRLRLNRITLFCPNSLKYLTRLKCMIVTCSQQHVRDDDDEGGDGTTMMANEEDLRGMEDFCRLDQIQLHSTLPTLTSLIIDDALEICPASLLTVLPTTLIAFEVFSGPGNYDQRRTWIDQLGAEVFTGTERNNSPPSRRRSKNWIENLLHPSLPAVSSESSSNQPGSFWTNLEVLVLDGLGLDDDDIRSLVHAVTLPTNLIANNGNHNQEGLDASHSSPSPSPLSSGVLFRNLEYLGVPRNQFTSLDSCLYDTVFEDCTSNTASAHNNMVTSTNQRQKTRLIILDVWCNKTRISTGSMIRFLDAFPEFRIGDCVGGGYDPVFLNFTKRHGEPAATGTPEFQEDLQHLHFTNVNHAGRILTSCSNKTKTCISSVPLSLVPLVLERAGNLDTWVQFLISSVTNKYLTPYSTEEACAANAVYFLLRNGPILAECRLSVNETKSNRKRQYLERKCKRKKLG